jgi:tRNA wybutosine-synthesizing protein 2
MNLKKGIGYFTLVYLVHSKAKHVYACEWNPASCEALANNLKLNNCQGRCTILEGDNRQVKVYFTSFFNKLYIEFFKI